MSDTPKEVWIGPDKIVAWPDYPEGWVTGRWSANTYDSDVAVEYTRTDARKPLDPELLAAVLWREQIVGTGTPHSTVAGRTPEAFAEAGDLVREPFLRYARAAIGVMK